MRGANLLLLALAASESTVLARHLLVPSEETGLSLYNQKRDPALSDYWSGDKAKITYARNRTNIL